MHSNKALPIIAMAYVTAKLVAILLFYKVITVFSINAAASTLIIPLWFCLGDVITEVYGYKTARTLVWVSAFCQLIFGWLIFVFNYLPSAPQITHINQAAYYEVFSNLPKGATASFLAIAIGGLVNAAILSKWKLMLNGKYFFIRSLGSTAIGEFVFTLCVYAIGFHGFASAVVIGKLILISFCIKMIINPIMITPISILTRFLKRYEQISNVTTGELSHRKHFTMVCSNESTKETFFVDEGSKLFPKNPTDFRAKNFPAKSFIIKNLEEGAFLNWHTVQQPQYIICLTSEIEIEVSRGNKRVFKSSDIVFLNDIVGDGHITRIIKTGQAIMIYI